MQYFMHKKLVISWLTKLFFNIFDILEYPILAKNSFNVEMHVVSPRPQ